MRYFLSCLSPRIHFYNCGSGRGEAPWRGGYPPPDSNPFSDVECRKNLQVGQDKIAAYQSPGYRPKKGTLNSFALDRRSPAAAGRRLVDCGRCGENLMVRSTPFGQQPY